MTAALKTVLSDRRVLLCGISSGVFEGCLYIYIFFWTPMIVSLADGQKIPFGVIFSTFMVCAMAGSSLQLFLSSYFSLKTEWIAVAVLVLASLSTALVSLLQTDVGILCALCGFQVCTGTWNWTICNCLLPIEKRSPHKCCTSEILCQACTGPQWVLQRAPLFLKNDELESMPYIGYPPMALFCSPY